jgi:uncharacterized membrane protein
MSTTPDSSGNGGSDRNPATTTEDGSLLRKLRGLGRFFEALVVLSLTFIAFGLYIIMSSSSAIVRVVCAVLIFLLVILAIIAFSLARRYNHMSQQASFIVERNSRYEITEQRLSTLAVTGVPADVLRCLRDMLAYDATSERLVINGEENFVAVLEERLGPERTREYEEVILRYTRARAAG